MQRRNEAENGLFVGEFKDFEETAVSAAATFKKREKGLNRKDRKDRKPFRQDEPD
jgi:hypothetical protein